MWSLFRGRIHLLTIAEACLDYKSSCRRLETTLSLMIRQAIRRDAAEAVPLIWQAIGDVAFVLTGTPDVQETTSILSDFFQQEDNRLSYQNALVMEEEGQLVGLVLLYDGAKAR